MRRQRSRMAGTRIVWAGGMGWQCALGERNLLGIQVDLICNSKYSAVFFVHWFSLVISRNWLPYDLMVFLACTSLMSPDEQPESNASEIFSLQRCEEIIRKYKTCFRVLSVLLALCIIVSNHRRNFDTGRIFRHSSPMTPVLLNLFSWPPHGRLSEPHSDSCTVWAYELLLGRLGF